jgi:GTP-binding protein
MLIDQATIVVAGGRGGNGCVSFRREKFVPRGGPNGGPGGDGGSVYLVADPSLKGLNAFRYKRRFEAERGRHGEGSDRAGHGGEDLHIKVPPGTTVRDEHGTLLADLSHLGDVVRVAAGGRGGRGNADFATSTHRLVLELKLIADVGIVGFPNAGKSTLISRISSARPKIAAYPFTTLEPNLGVVDLGEFRTFVVADIPGLIEGAHHGQGLGMKFLRHIERTRVLVHLVDASEMSGRDPVGDLDVVNAEMRAFGEGLAGKPQVVAAAKIDALADRERLSGLRARCASAGVPFHAISAVSGEGVRDLLEEVWSMLAAQGDREAPIAAPPRDTLRAPGSESAGR